MKNQVCRLLSSVLFVLVTSVSAEAANITVSFYTTGAFGGCTSSVITATSATCVRGTTTLTYAFNGSAVTPASVGLTDALPSANVAYGGFTTSGGTSSSDFSGVSFTLSLFQTTPSVGSQALFGVVSGQVAALTGQLLWGPVTPQNWNIGLVHWTVDLDAATQSIRIDAPDAGGAPGLTQTIRGTASMVPAAAVPEPASLLLLGAGLAGLVVRLRRRR